jgi:coenzyme F420-dependent glucose-6-phosphate dehydrogenase
MLQIGYWLSSEEHPPTDLVRHARRAEEIGFRLAMISDHFHPWVDRQGHAPFVWSILGAIAHATERLRVGTGVTCPTIRTHPIIIAQAAATTAAMMPGRFFLGVGTGENLNEHVTGAKWPPFAVRLAMLEEAVAIMRQAWAGDLASHRGTHYTVENARLYTLPPAPPPIMIAAAGPEAATLAGRIGDGLINTSPEREVVDAFAAAGGARKPRFANMALCWAEDTATATRTAHEIWPISGLKGPLSQELPLPQHFEAAASLVTEEMVAESVVCGPDPEPYLEGIRRYAEAGFDHLCLHQIGPDQAGFFRFFERSLAPRLGEVKAGLDVRSK